MPDTITSAVLKFLWLFIPIYMGMNNNYRNQSRNFFFFYTRLRWGRPLSIRRNDNMLTHTLTHAYTHVHAVHAIVRLHNIMWVTTGKLSHCLQVFSSRLHFLRGPVAGNAWTRGYNLLWLSFELVSAGGTHSMHSKQVVFSRKKFDNFPYGATLFSLIFTKRDISIR